MQLILPYARGQKEIDGDLFLAAWQVWHERYAPNHEARCLDAAMPRLARQVGLQAQLANQNRFSLDVLCRMLLPPSSRDTMQAPRAMMLENEALLTSCEVVNPATGAKVDGARLSPAGQVNAELARRARPSDAAARIASHVPCGAERRCELDHRAGAMNTMSSPEGLFG